MENLADPVLRITWVTDTDRHLLPPGMTTDKGKLRYPADRIALMEKQIQKRAARILNGR